MIAFNDRIDAGSDATAFELEGVIRLVRDDSPVAAAGGDVVPGLKKPVTPQTKGQKAYLSTLRDAEAGLVFGTGPAGTGKTFLAVAVGASELKSGRRERLIVARPLLKRASGLDFCRAILKTRLIPTCCQSGMR